MAYLALYVPSHLLHAATPFLAYLWGALLCRRLCGSMLRLGNMLRMSCPVAMVITHSWWEGCPPPPWDPTPQFYEQKFARDVRAKLPCLRRQTIFSITNGNVSKQLRGHLGGGRCGGQGWKVHFFNRLLSARAGLGTGTDGFPAKWFHTATTCTLLTGVVRWRRGNISCCQQVLTPSRLPTPSESWLQLLPLL